MSRPVPGQRYTQTRQDLRGVAIVAHDPDQDVLGADLFVPHVPGLSEGPAEHPAGRRSEGASTGGLWDA